MTYPLSHPDIIRNELNAAVQHAFNSSTFAAGSEANRNRLLDREKVINFLISAEGGSLDRELDRADIPVSATALINYRKKISPALMEDILTAFVAQRKDPLLYKGYRLLAVDGTAVNAPRDSRAPTFVVHAGAPEGYNQYHVTPLFDVLNKVYVSCAIQPQPEQDEIGALYNMLAWSFFDEPTIIIGDRLYSSCNLFETIRNMPQCYFVIRVKQGTGAMREVAKLPMTRLDVDVHYTITTTQTNMDKEQGYIYIQTRKNENRAYSDKTRNGRWDFPSPYPTSLRIVRFMLPSGEYETLATNLPRNTFTAEDLSVIYHYRWNLECGGGFRSLKYDLGLNNVHSRTDTFIRQEIYASMIAANFCSRVIQGVVLEQDKGRKYEYAVNRKRAVALCKEFLRTPGADGEELMRKIAKYTVPIRPDRADERKLRVKSFPGFVYRVAA